MDVTPLVIMAMLTGILVTSPFRVPDLRRIAAHDLGVVLVAGAVGALLGGSVGLLVATLGVSPGLARLVLRRRIESQLQRERGEEALTAVALFERSTWSSSTWFGLVARRRAFELAGRTEEWFEYLTSDARRPSISLDMMRVMALGLDGPDVVARAWDALRIPRLGESRAGAIAVLSFRDLSGLLDWYRSRAGSAAMSPIQLVADVMILEAAGRPTAARRLLASVSVSDHDLATCNARARLAAGEHPDTALAELRSAGPAGRAAADTLVRMGVGPQPLDDDLTRIVDRIEAGVDAHHGAFGHDVGTWRPVVTWTIMAAVVVGFLRQLAAGSITVPTLVDQGAVVLGGSVDLRRSVISPYLHADTAHVALNLLAIAILGRLVEGRLGRTRYLTVWLVGSWGSFVLLTLLVDRQAVVVGASGGILALAGAGIGWLVVTRRHLPHAAVDQTLRFLLIIVVLQWCLDLVVPNVAWQAHLLGLVIGVVLGAAFALAAAARATAGNPRPTPAG